MLTKVNSIGLLGIDGFVIETEIDVSNGMPSFEIVGLPDSAVKESRERIGRALRNSGIELRPKRIVVNLAPANIKKEGSHLDMAIAIGVLCSYGYLDPVSILNYVFLGETSLDGSLKSICGALPMTISAFQNGFKNIFVPEMNAVESSIVKGMNVYGAPNLNSVFKHLKEEKFIKKTSINLVEIFSNSKKFLPDFNEVKGQENVKRALEVAASGGHNCLLIGPPGSGKTMLAGCIPSILPDISFEESLEVTKIHSISSKLPSEMPIVIDRPFRNPHHTISAIGLSGGGKIPKPGEISLAHNGVLFLDEFPEFRKDAIEVLRQPLENGTITISRVGGSFTYPCNIMFIASMNPCPCGFYGDPTRNCNCPHDRILKYLSKISGPLLDRIDLHVEVFPVKYKELESNEKIENSEEIKKRVNKTRNIQLERYEKDKIYSNSKLTPKMMSKYCSLGEKENKILREAFERLGLSARAHNRILKVARTIADMDNSDDIKNVHLAEAIQYRSLDRKFWS
ncbi:MAG: YifB family Mg chelatase-like AAA ATPase [Clostridiales bacterium]|jgi:magnesium chelatase family protein|nr:YifB family Mg chelatase-like AAA ATPase [Clostridiales bacterium]